MVLHRRRTTTTSIREEPYQAAVIEHFALRAVIGKGGMGQKTLQACQQFGAVYLHAIGGAATLIGRSVKEVLTVYKLDFGVPEAFWSSAWKTFPLSSQWTVTATACTSRLRPARPLNSPHSSPADSCRGVLPIRP